MGKEKLIAHSDMLGLSSVLREAETPMGKDRDSEKSDEEEKEECEKVEAFEEKKRKTRSTIVLSVSDRVLEASDRLYMSKALPNQIYLKQKLYRFKMSENLSMEGNIDEFLHIVADLENLNVLVSDEDQTILLLMSLPKSFDQLKDTLQYSSGKTVLTLDEVTAAIYSKELEFGSVKKSIKGMFVSEALSSTDIHLEDEWIMDTGCSYHMTHKREWLEDFDEEAGCSVRMGNKTISRVKGVGTVRIANDNGLTVTLQNVRYISDMDRIFLSLGTFEKAGRKFESENDMLRVNAGEQVLLEGRRYDTLYILHGKPATDESLAVAKANDDIVLWHRRLCHMSQKNMSLLVKKGFLDKKKVSMLDTCEDCIYGKAKKIGFNFAQHDTKEKLEYVHYDLWGAPTMPMALGNCQYFISFIDDHTRKVCVYFLKTKDEAFEKFVSWISLVENQSGNRVKTLRTDNGLEFCNRMFDGFCEERGIQRHRTCPYTPQQNGVVERMNRTIMERVRSMLCDSRLPKRFWAEATHTAVLLINKTPCSANNFEFPDKRWSGKAPIYSYLRRYGCVTFVQTDDGKLNLRAKKGVLIGYPSGVKGYKVWLIEERNSHLVRDRERRVIRAPRRFDDEDYFAETLYTTEDVKHVSIRILLSIVAQKNLELEQLDVETAFFHGELKEKIYMMPPEGFESLFKENEVCLLNKSLYGLKQAPRQWNEKFDHYMTEIGFKRSDYDSCSTMYLLLYVYDMLVAANNMQAIDALKKELSNKLEMKDLGATKKILGIEIIRDR
ncbi:putative polyprotein [Arabidopsis thaliana]|uniref:Putative polyprotein n=1 Tax=Arabidopsis thaliana TaxID=3702 RepID=Q9XE97_ARATH|nr:putative polyprotein [Arabidopsis thaliana]CAB77906.1 putative polyprotein [Arabidopsis thaliana]